ncbi:MAG: helix-turn-helix domain-containing protein [Clostridiales bacterium]|jgi:excisionase family DNA binding protein|nr:helix-turn-helix domain-containing protein [Clostridiales bacterium]
MAKRAVKSKKETEDQPKQAPPSWIEQWLPKKELLRLDEVAIAFDVSESTIRRWIDHHHFTTVRPTGAIVRITRASVVEFSLKKMFESRNMTISDNQ